MPCWSLAAKSLLLASSVQKSCSSGSSQKSWFTYSSKSTMIQSMTFRENIIGQKYIVSVNVSTEISTIHTLHRYSEDRSQIGSDNRFCYFDVLDTNIMGDLFFNGKHRFSFVCIWKALNQKHTKYVVVQRAALKCELKATFPLNTKDIFSLLFLYLSWWFLMFPWISDEVCLSGGQV